MTEYPSISLYNKITSHIKELEKQPDGKSYEYNKKYSHKNKAEIRGIMKKSLMNKYRCKLEQRKEKNN